MKYEDYYKKQADMLYNLIVSTNQKWRKEWVSDGFNQQNKDGIEYKRSNQIMLFSSAYENNYQDPRWLTFNQIKKNGYKLEKGSKGEQIAFTTKTQQILKKNEDGKPELKDGEKQYITVFLDKPILKIYTVFNASKILGIEPFKLNEISQENSDKIKQQNYIDADNMIKRFCEKNGINLKVLPSDKAFFSNGSNDKSVVVPLKSQFKNIDSYYSTLFHEVAHSTKVLGIRINKEVDTPLGNNFGSKNYAKEELTAELTALFLCKEFKIDSSGLADTKNNSMAYLKNWIETGILQKEDLSISLQEANKAAQVIYNEHLSIKQEEQKENIQEIKLLFSESSNDKNISFQNLNQVQEWFEKTYSKNNITNLGYDKNYIEIHHKNDDGNIKQSSFRIDVSTTSGDFNPLTDKIQNHLKANLEKLNIKDISMSEKKSIEISEINNSISQNKISV